MIVIDISFSLSLSLSNSTSLSSGHFGIHYTDIRLFAQPVSGRSPRALTLDKLSEMGFNRASQWPPCVGSSLRVTVPGAPAAWEDLYKLHGSGKVFTFIISSRLGLMRSPYLTSFQSSDTKYITKLEVRLILYFYFKWSGLHSTRRSNCILTTKKCPNLN